VINEVRDIAIHSGVYSVWALAISLVVIEIKEVRTTSHVVLFATSFRFFIADHFAHVLDDKGALLDRSQRTHTPTATVIRAKDAQLRITTTLHHTIRAS